MSCGCGLEKQAAHLLSPESFKVLVDDVTANKILPMAPGGREERERGGGEQVKVNKTQYGEI